MAKKTTKPAPAEDTNTGLVTEDNDFAQLLDEHLRAGYQALYVHTAEEARAEVEITRVARRLNMGVVTWDCYEGFSCDALSGNNKYKNAVSALEALNDEALFNGNQVFIFRDLDDFMVDTNVRRRIRTLTEGNRLVNKKHKRPIIILSPKLSIHDKVKANISVVEFLLPGEAKLARTVEFVRQSIESKDPEKAQCTDELRAQLVTNLLGLTANEAENCLARCLVRHSGFSPEMLSTIKDEKAAIVKKSEVLTYIPEGAIASREEIGGFDQYLTWLERRKQAYLPSARAMNIDYPRGVVLLGLPGTGKSMVGKATCQLLGLPGYILDIGSLFGSLVGESEQRTHDVLKQIDAQKGCVLLIDEADKALGHAHTSQGDSGVTKRVFGTILTWLAENQSKTFCIMTLNRTEGLPPELTRAGRFDAMWYTDLPNSVECQQIMEIHFKKRGVDMLSMGLDTDDWTMITEKLHGFVGSEIEEAVREARYIAFEKRHTGDPTFEEIIEAAASIVPISQRDSEGVEAIRKFCKDKARPVTTPLTISSGKQHGRAQRSVEIDN